MYLAISNLTPVKFYPYTSIVLDHVFETSWGDDFPYLQYMRDCLAMFEEAGIKAHQDNKIVFQFKTRYGNTPVYIGFYDNRMSIGFAVRTGI